MIKIAEREKYQILKEKIFNDIFQNVYLYIDSQLYGFNSTEVKTYILENKDEIKVILYHYYNSLQLFQISSVDDNEIKEICNHILKYKFNMISGNKEFCSKIQTYLNNEYKIVIGCVMNKEQKAEKYSNQTIFAKPDDCLEIAKLICSDHGIGGHYNIEELKNQLIERMTTKNCVNLILKKQKIVAHAATYADCESIAVIGGVITDEECRGLGYGKTVVNDLTVYIQDSNKIPVLYCYNDKTIKWYESLGFKKVSECAKLELCSVSSN